MREWIYCAGCETRLQDDDQELSESVITESEMIEYRYTAQWHYFCDRTCQLQYKIQKKIDALERRVNGLSDRLTQLDN
jgi:hypothetical protein